MGEPQKGGRAHFEISVGKQKGVEHNFWLKFSGGKNLGGNYDKINPTAFVHNSNYNCFFRNPIYLWQKHVKRNGVRYDIMNAAISHKCRSITFYYGITSRKNYENLIVQIHNFIIENGKVSKYGVFSGPSAGKYGPEKTPYLDTFHAVNVSCRWHKFT